MKTAKEYYLNIFAALVARKNPALPPYFGVTNAFRAFKKSLFDNDEPSSADLALFSLDERSYGTGSQLAKRVAGEIAIMVQDGENTDTLAAKGRLVRIGHSCSFGDDIELSSMTAALDATTPLREYIRRARELPGTSDDLWAARRIHELVDVGTNAHTRITQWQREFGVFTPIPNREEFPYLDKIMWEHISIQDIEEMMDRSKMFSFIVDDRIRNWTTQEGKPIWELQTGKLEAVKEAGQRLENGIAWKWL